MLSKFIVRLIGLPYYLVAKADDEVFICVQELHYQIWFIVIDVTEAPTMEIGKIQSKLDITVKCKLAA